MAIRKPNNIFEQLVKQSGMPTPAPAPLPETSDPISNFLASPSYRIAPAAVKDKTALKLAMYDPGELGLETPEPVADSIFGNAFQAGIDTMSANRSYFKMLVNDAKGDTEAADENLAEAQRFQGLAAEALAGIDGPQTFTELTDEPSFGGALTYALSTVGQFAPSALASITAAMIGAATAAIIAPGAIAVGGVAALGAGAASRGASKAAIKRLMKRAINKKVKGEKLSRDENDFLDFSYKYLKEYGPKKFVSQNRKAVGGLAGAFTQEFTQGSGITYGDFAEQDMRGGREAGLSLLGGTAYGLIGTGGEAYVVKGLKDSFMKALKRSGSRSYFKQIGASVLDAGKRGAIGEGAAEFGQEGISITQKLNIDDEYTNIMARKDAINALVAGALGGGIIGGVGGGAGGALSAAGPRIARKSGEYVDKFQQAREEEAINDALDTEEFGFNRQDINDINSAPEDPEWINAQFDTMMDPKNNKNAMWIAAPLGEQRPNYNAEIKELLKKKELYEVYSPTLKGAMLTTDREKADRLNELILSGTANASVWPEDPETGGQTEMPMGSTNLDIFLADALGYSNVRQAEDDISLEVVNRKGVPVHYQSTSKKGHAAAVQAARVMFNNKLGKDQDYMFYQDFHNQKNKDGKFMMRSVESHLIDRHNKQQDILIDNMASVMDPDAIDQEAQATRQQEADENEGTADAITDAKADHSFIYESNEESIKKELLTEVTRGKQEKVVAFVPYSNVGRERTKQYQKKLEEVLEIFRGRDPIFTKQNYDSFVDAAAEKMVEAAEALATKEGISLVEAQDRVNSKFKNPQELEEYEMVGRSMKDVLSDLNPRTDSEIELEEMTGYDPRSVYISEQNLNDIRANNIKTLVEAKKGPYTPANAAKETKAKFPDTLIGQPILVLAPESILNTIIKLSKNSEFDNQKFEIAIAEEEDAQEGSRYIAPSNPAGSFVVRVVSEDPSKALNIIHTKKRVEYALADALQRGRREAGDLNLPGAYLELTSIPPGVKESVLETQLNKYVSEESLAFLNLTALTAQGGQIMQANNLGPLQEGLNTKDERLRFQMSAFVTILHELGNLGYTITLHKPGEYRNPEINYDLIEGLNKTFPEVIGAADTQNPKQLDVFDIDAEAKQEELIELNQGIIEQAKNLLKVDEKTVNDLIENKTIAKEVLKKQAEVAELAVQAGAKKSIVIKTLAEDIKDLNALLEKSAKIKEELANIKTPQEKIEEATLDPDVSPAEVLPKGAILDRNLLRLFQNIVFFTPKRETMVALDEKRRGAGANFEKDLARNVTSGKVDYIVTNPEAKPDKQVKIKEFDTDTAVKYTLADILNSFDKSPVSSLLRKAYQTSKRLEIYNNAESQRKTVQQYVPQYRKKVPYTQNEFFTDLELLRKLEGQIETLGYEQVKKNVWIPNDAFLRRRGQELLAETIDENRTSVSGKVTVDWKAQFLNADEMYGKELVELQEKEQNEKNRLEKLQTEISKTPKGYERDQLKETESFQKKVLGTIKKQIYTIEQLFDTNDPAFLKTVPSAGWSYPVYTLKEELQFNVGSLPGLSAKEEGGIKGIIKKLKDIRNQYRDTGNIIVSPLRESVLEGKKAEEYIATQKRLRLYKFGKKGTTKKTKTSSALGSLPFGPRTLEKTSMPWSFETKVGKKYWEPVGEIKPLPRYAKTKTLAEKEITKLEKQFKEDGKIVLEQTLPVVLKGKKATQLINKLSRYTFSLDGKLFTKVEERQAKGKIILRKFLTEVKIETEEVQVRETKVAYGSVEFATLTGLDRGYVSRAEADILQKKELNRNRKDLKVDARSLSDRPKSGDTWSSAISSIQKKDRDKKADRLLNWESAQSFDGFESNAKRKKGTSELKRRSIGRAVDNTKTMLPNYTDAFVSQLEQANKKLGLDKLMNKEFINQETGEVSKANILKGYMDSLFSTISSSFRIDPNINTLVVSSTEDINTTRGFENTTPELKMVIQNQQSLVNSSSANKLAQGVRAHGNGVFASRIRLNGGRENIIILRVANKAKPGPNGLTASGFLFSISKAYGHEIAHIALDSESNWSNDMGVIFKNYPALKKAYAIATADPNAPAEWKNERNGAAEWFADNISLWANEKVKKPKNIVESMFKRLADMMEKAWQKIAAHIRERFNVEKEGYKSFENEINKIIAEKKRQDADEAADNNRWNLTTTEAWTVDNLKESIVTWEDIGGKRGIELQNSVLRNLQKSINGKMSAGLAMIIKPADNFMAHHIGLKDSKGRTRDVGIGKKIMRQVFYGRSQSQDLQGLLQAVSSRKNSFLTELARTVLGGQTDADWGMLQSENPDLLVVENSNYNTHEMEAVPTLTFDQAVKHAELHPEYIYLHSQEIPPGYEVGKNMHQMPASNDTNILNGFFNHQVERKKRENKRGFIIVGKPKAFLNKKIASLRPRRTIPKLSGKKTLGKSTLTWAFWEGRYVPNVGIEKGQITQRQYDLRVKMEQFFWDNNLGRKGIGFRENYWPRMFDFIEIGAQPELRKKLIKMLVEANTAANTRFRREILTPPNSPIPSWAVWEKLRDSKGEQINIRGVTFAPEGANQTYGKEVLVDSYGTPLLTSEKEQIVQYFEFFDMNEEYATKIVNTLADGNEQSFAEMENDGFDEEQKAQWIGYELGLGVLPHRAKAFAALNTAALRKEKLIVDPAIAMDRSISQIVKKLEYDERGGWQTVAKLLEEIEDPVEYGRALKAVKHLLGKYDTTMSPQFRQLNSWALFMNISSLLAFATFASFPDFAGPILRSKEFRAFKEVIPLLMEMAGNPAEARRLAKDIGVVASESMELMWIHSPQMDWQTHRAQKASSFFFKYTGLESFTKFTRYFAAGMGQRFLANHAERAVNGKGIEKARSIRYLKELNNIKSSEIKQWEAAGFSFEALDTKTAGNIKLALARFVDESIVRPSAAERPVWASDPRFALIWQLKSFFYAYGKNIVGGVARESISRQQETGSNLAVIPPLLLMAAAILPLTMLGWDLRERTKYAIRYAIPWQTADWDKIGKTDQMLWTPYLIELSDRSGAFGPWTMVRQMYTKAQWQEMWLTPLLGPTAEKGEDFLKALFTDADWQWKKNLPLGQLAQYD